MTPPDIILATPGSSVDLEHQLFICALEVQKNLGPESPENACRDCLAFELERRHIPFSFHAELMNRSGTEESPSGFRVDFLLENRIIVEVRSRPTLPTLLQEQYRSYLRLSGLPLAIVINFQAPDPRNLFTRITR